jgi:glyoxylase-like metal-dependent hydrolase (beta-lactamase superfamily II)
LSAAIEVLKYTIGPFAENAYVVVGPSGKRAMLIDPGIGSEEILGVLQERGLDLALIVNTHGHLDHVAGNALFKQRTGAPLVIHRLDVPYLERVAQQAAMFGLKAPNSPPPDDFLEEGKPLRFDGLEFEVIHTPGHTPGGVCLRLGDVMWVGDTLFAGSVGRTDLPGGSWPDLLRSIREKLFVLPEHILCYTGHGDDTTLGEERRTNEFVSDAAIAGRGIR